MNRHQGQLRLRHPGQLPAHGHDQPPLLFPEEVKEPLETAMPSLKRVGSCPFTSAERLVRASTTASRATRPAFLAVAAPACAARAVRRLCLSSKALCSSNVRCNGIPRKEPSVKLISMSEEESWLKSFAASPTTTAHQLLQWISFLNPLTCNSWRDALN